MIKGMNVVRVVMGAFTILKKNQDNPPKYAIANGFVIGHLPEILSFKDKNGDAHIRNINVDWDLDDVICAAIRPVRPF